jgi:hypothetical protein
MKFLLDIELDADEGPITAEQFREHLQTYQFDTGVVFEMSLIPGDPYHELGDNTKYVSYRVTSAEVTIVEE